MNRKNDEFLDDTQVNSCSIRDDSQEEQTEKSTCANRKVLPAEFMFFIFKVAEGILEPGVRLYLYDAVCLDRYPDSEFRGVCSNLSSDHDKEIVVQEVSAKYLAYYKLLINLPAMAMVLCCGMWSDRSGRVTPIIFTCLGSSLACVMFMISSIKVLWENSNLVMILLGASVRGLFGRSAIMTMAVNSYVSDHSLIHTRTRHLSNLIAMSNFGYLLGSSISGILLEKWHSSFVFMIVTILNTVCVLIAYFLLTEQKDIQFKNNEEIPEAESLPLISEVDALAPRYNAISTPRTLAASATVAEDASSDIKLRCGVISEPDNALPQSSGDRNVSFQGALDHAHVDGAVYSKRLMDKSISKSFRHFTECFYLLVKKRSGGRRYEIWALLFVLYLHQMNKSGEGDIYLLFVRRFPLSVSKSTYGYLVSVTYGSLGLFAFCVPKLLGLIKCQVKDSTLALIGIIFKIGSLIFLCFSRTVWMLVVVSVFAGTTSLTVSSVRSLVSKIVESEELGRAFSLIASGETLCNFIGSLIYTSIYSATAQTHPGISFILEAVVYAALAFIMVQISFPLLGCDPETIRSTENTQSDDEQRA